MTDTALLASRQLWVLRHAKAAADSPDGLDHSRPLTKRGRHQAEAAARFLARARTQGALLPRVILCSSATRALQTAELVLPALGNEVTLQVERDLYRGRRDGVVRRVRGVEEDVLSLMVVGHNPTFAELALSLVSEADAAGRSRLEDFPTCALAQIGMPIAAWAQLAVGTGRLEALFVPER